MNLALGELGMAKKGRLRSGRPTIPSGSKVHDRRADKVGQGIVASPIQVDDPYEPGARIVVLRSLRDDPLARLHDRKQIDEAQYVAGRHWQRAYEIAEVGGARAIDTTKEAVDGGFIPEPFTDAQRRAVADLARAGRAVGMMGETVLRDVLALGMTTEQVAMARGSANRVSIEFYGRLFRTCLDGLAVEFGYAMRERGLTPGAKGV